MGRYEEICAFCNEVGEEMPEAITTDLNEPTMLLYFTQFLFKLLTMRGDTPLHEYPQTEAYIEKVHDALIRQWYVKSRKVEDDDPITLTFRWKTKSKEKTFDVICSFERAMELTDILGTAEDYDCRLKAVRKWLADEGRPTPSDLKTLQIITDDQILNITI